MSITQRFFSLLGVLFAPILLISCGESAGDSPNDDLVQYDIDLQVSDPQALSGDKRDIYQRLQNNEPVSFSKITDVFLRNHINNYNSRAKAQATNEWSGDTMAVDPVEAERKIEQILQDVPTDDFHQMKVEYEKNLETAGAILYDKDAVSVADFVSRNRVQCYSGTSFHEIAARRLLGPVNFRMRNPVVIFENGHVLPGYMTKSGEDWVMTGVETTTSGPSKVTYGKTKDLQGAVRVVDAELFVLVEIFKSDIDNTDAVLQQVLQMTAQKYDIPLTQTENLTRAATASAKPDQNKERERVLNSSPFAFGQPQVPDEEMPRAYLEERDAKEPRGINGLVDARVNPHLGMEDIRRIVDTRFELKDACGLKGRVSFNDLPASAQAAVTEALSIFDKGRLEDAVAQFIVQDCILFASYESGARTENSGPVELPGPGMPEGKNAYQLTEEILQFDRVNMLIQIFDLSLGEVILPLSTFKAQAYESVEGDHRLVLVSSEFKSLSEPPSPFYLSVLSMSERNIVAHIVDAEVKSLSDVKEKREEIETNVHPAQKQKLLNEPGVIVETFDESGPLWLDLKTLQLEKIYLNSDDPEASSNSKSSEDQEN